MDTKTNEQRKRGKRKEREKEAHTNTNIVNALCRLEALTHYYSSTIWVINQSLNAPASLGDGCPTLVVASNTEKTKLLHKLDSCGVCVRERKLEANFGQLTNDVDNEKNGQLYFWSSLIYEKVLPIITKNEIGFSFSLFLLFNPLWYAYSIVRSRTNKQNKILLLRLSKHIVWLVRGYHFFGI